MLRTPRLAAIPAIVGLPAALPASADDIKFPEYPSLSPDGETLFVNLQSDGLTLAIWGPWSKLRRG